MVQLFKKLIFLLDLTGSEAEMTNYGFINVCGILNGSDHWNFKGKKSSI
jgi:hypothetical protein